MLALTMRCTCTITLAGITAFSGILATPVPTDITLILPTEPIPVGSVLSIGLIGPNKGPDQLFSATQLYVTGSSDVPNNPTNASSWADAGGINHSGVPSWDRTTGDFASLLESRQYCASASPSGGGTFNYNTSTWVPGTYELRVRTIVYYGSDGVESNGTAPGGGEQFCISPPYTNYTAARTVTLNVVTGSGSDQPLPSTTSIIEFPRGVDAAGNPQSGPTSAAKLTAGSLVYTALFAGVALIGLTGNFS